MKSSIAMLFVLSAVLLSAAAYTRDCCPDDIGWGTLNTVACQQRDMPAKLYQSCLFWEIPGNCTTLIIAPDSYQCNYGPSYNTDVLMNWTLDEESGLNVASLLAETLKVHTNITELNLKYSGIGPAAATTIAAALKVNTAITRVWLDGNQIGDAGAASIGEALLENTAISRLSLTDNEIGDAGAASIAEALKVNTAITGVFLSHNQIGAVGAASIAEALKVNTAITEVWLTFNQIGDDGAASIAEVLLENTGVLYWYLDFNNIHDAGAALIAEALLLNTVVTEMILSDVTITDQGLLNSTKASCRFNSCCGKRFDSSNPWYGLWAKSHNPGPCSYPALHGPGSQDCCDSDGCQAKIDAFYAQTKAGEDALKAAEAAQAEADAAAAAAVAAAAGELFTWMAGGQGQKYGALLGSGANINAVAHGDGKTIEFFLDGVLQGSMQVAGSAPEPQGMVEVAQPTTNLTIEGGCVGAANADAEDTASTTRLQRMAPVAASIVGLLLSV